jgi:hypothetical protein
MNRVIQSCHRFMQPGITQVCVAYATRNCPRLFGLLLALALTIGSAETEPARVAVLDFSVAGVTGEGKSWDSATGKFKPVANKPL